MPAPVRLTSVTLDQLRALVAVVEAGSFGAAARRLGRVQSAVSHAVATLEEHLGVALFDRGGYRARLTPAGAAVLADARRVLDAVETLGVSAAGFAEATETEVGLVVDALFPLTALVGFARRFEARWPAVALRVQTETLSEVLARVEADRGAIGVANGTLDLDGFERRPLGAVGLVHVVAAEHPLARLDRPVGPDDLAPYVQVVLSGRGREAGAPDRGVYSRQTWRVLDLGAKRAFILAGLGWGGLPPELVADDLAAGRLRRLHLALPAPEPIPLFAVWRADARLGPAARWAVHELAALGEAATG